MHGIAMNKRHRFTRLFLSDRAALTREERQELAAIEADSLGMIELVMTFEEESESDSAF